jgi:hypothetical protein
MRQSLAIAFSLIKIKRLFCSLILIPLALSLVVVAIQVVTSTLIIQVTNKTSGKVDTSVEEGVSFLRSIATGSDKPLPEALICRWRMETDDLRQSVEVPPNAQCEPDRLDAAIKVSNPDSFDPKEYILLLNGVVQRIHLCKTCQPDLLFIPEKNERRVEIRSIWAALLVRLITQNDSITEAFATVRKTNFETSEAMGKRYFIAPGFRSPINLTDMRSSLLLIFNFSSLIVVSLWLALKAHRRILDYFSHNGALLPMVAATGKENFYGALWIITCIRVSAFLISALPLTIYSLHEYMIDQATIDILGGAPANALVWGATLIASLSLATLIASIADLKHRSHLLVFTYRFLPLILAFIGAFFWAITFLVDTDFSSILRAVICAVPVIGMVPMFISLVFQPHLIALLLHGILSAALIVYLMRLNSQWFGAHLEEV